MIFLISENLERRESHHKVDPLSEDIVKDKEVPLEAWLYLEIDRQHCHSGYQCYQRHLLIDTCRGRGLMQVSWVNCDKLKKVAFVKECGWLLVLSQRNQKPEMLKNQVFSSGKSYPGREGRLQRCLFLYSSQQVACPVSLPDWYTSTLSNTSALGHSQQNEDPVN